jgi:mRNA interferase RelE/StbE
MKTTFRQSFLRDIKNIKEKQVLLRIEKVIEQVESAQSLDDIADLKKLGGSKTAYRIRVGVYRLGLHYEKGAVEFVRCLNRKDLYRFFP